MLRSAAALIYSLRTHHSGASLGRLAVLFLGTLTLCQCSSTGSSSGGMAAKAADCVVSVKEQKLAYYRDGHQVVSYAISTSRFGISDRPGHYGTPPGLMQVVAKIGHGVAQGTVFHNRQPTGEVIKPGSPGRDPIVSRIMWLRGMESQNQNAYSRCIYIHGTADEAEIGKPVSWGCIRMKSSDVVSLFNALPIGARVLVTEDKLPSEVPVLPPTPGPPATSRPPLELNPDSGLAAAGNHGGPREPEPPPGLAVASAAAAPTRPSVPDAVARTLPASAYQVRTMNDGSTVYTPQDSGAPGMILRSTHTATSSYETDKKPVHGQPQKPKPKPSQSTSSSTTPGQ